MTNIIPNLTINLISIDGLLGILTRDDRMVGADESTELCAVLLHNYAMLKFVYDIRILVKKDYN